ncbi:riboflavin synthase [Clostridium algifaecis]|uniref:Riboflavin synthase n=1 Tax=Clostridium algifaecis TaxID=1472040 RepID=A0ABS4KVJ9_9CLOT|nr:riboflavin synthase [Clostridium algifaecis]MBP2033426.1 riboflavin synthase [Clostridium algifaecis]
MFTGLVEEIGEVLKLEKGINSSKISIKAESILDGVKLGDSIAVNGTCVTVVDFRNNLFTVDVMAETLRMSNLRNVKIGSKVNLERALRLGDRLGGHIVSGHIDGTGKIINIRNEDISTWIDVEVSKNLLKYIVLKGSITIDGVSLTVAELNEKYFSVSLIPHTKSETILNYKKIGDIVNIECDLIGKYVEKMISNSEKKEQRKSGNVNVEKLKEYGFM